MERVKRKRRIVRKGKRATKTAKAGKVRSRRLKRAFSAKAVNNMIDGAHTRGYQEGYRDGQSAGGRESYQKGHTAGYEEAYKRGLYDGGDGIVDSILPADAILPEISIRQIIEAGVAQLQPAHGCTLQSAAHIADRLQAALDAKEPFSLVRLGDGEALTLAQEAVLSIDEVKREGSFLGYAGVNVPDLQARDELAESIRKATVVGVPKMRIYTYQPLCFQAFRAHGIDYRSLSLANSIVNYDIYKLGRIGGLLRGRNVLLVGNVAPKLATVLSEHGIRIAGAISPVAGVRDVPRVVEEIGKHSFDIALVSSGIAAVVISQKIASDMGKVAIDFGHLADSLAARRDPFV